MYLSGQDRGVGGVFVLGDPGDEGAHLEDVLDVAVHLVEKVARQSLVQGRAENDVGLRQLKPNFKQDSLR